MRKTGLVFHEDYLRHNAGEGHPERPARLERIMSHLTETKLLEKLVRIEPYTADIDWIATIHSRDYIDSVKRACQQDYHYLDSDTGICRDSFQVALLAAGGAMAAAEAVMDKKVDNAFAALRPPGHHAERDRAMGFCLFNNIAITARYLQQKYRVEKVLIIDWDVHHGNGTQNAFYDDPTVFYFSTHQWPHYPGSGWQLEKGIGKGEGFTLNVPLSAGRSNEDFIRIFEQQLVPAAQQFKPDFILISAGFDAHLQDPLAGMQLTEKGYGELTRIVVELAEELCGGRIVSLLEGGYHLEMLARSVASHIMVLMGG